MARYGQHGDATTVPVLAKVKTRTGRPWANVRADRPFGGKDSPAVRPAAGPPRRSGVPIEQPSVTSDPLALLGARDPWAVSLHRRHHHRSLAKQKSVLH